ncbi:hypothetical protein Tco_0651234 [Tanacetum coccineum]
MPNPLPNSQAPQNLDDFDHGTLAILSMGNGYARPAPRSTGESKVGNFGRRLFHKVDRIQAAGQNDREGGEFVYQKNEASRVENLGKLGPKREGPYLVVEVYQNGSYKLCTMDDREVSRVCEQSSQSP